MELSRNLRIDSVSRLQPTPPRQIDADLSIEAAVEVLRSERVGCVLVVKHGKLAGLFTERDLLTRVLAAGKGMAGPVSSVMTADPVTVMPKDPIRLAVKRMQSGGYRHLPVVDEAGRPVGILSAKRIIHYLAEHFPETIYNQPPDPKQVPATAEGA